MGLVLVATSGAVPAATPAVLLNSASYSHVRTLVGACSQQQAEQQQYDVRSFLCEWSM